MKKRKVKLFASIASLGLVVAVMGVGVWAATQQAVKVSSQVSFTATSVAADISLAVTNKTGAVENSRDDIVKEAALSFEMQDGSAVNYAPTEGKELCDETGSTGINQYLARFDNDTEKTLYENKVYLNLADKDEDGYLNVDAQVVYTFTITALESSAPIYYNIYANLFDTPITGVAKSYAINQVFDVTITDTDITTAAAGAGTTDNATGTNTATISNWTHGDSTSVTTTEDVNAIQPGETRLITVTYTVKDLGEGAAESDPFYGYQGISYTMKSLQLGDIYIRLANNGKNLGTLPGFESFDEANQGQFEATWGDYTKEDGEDYPAYTAPDAND